MKRLYPLTLLVLLLSPFVLSYAGTLLDLGEPAQKAKAPLQIEEVNLSGIYLLAGKENGKPYEGVAILEKFGNAYRARWSTLGESYYGVGIFQGKQLSMGWTVKDQGTGVTVYEVSADRKTLKGHWTALPGKGELVSETLTYLRPLSKPKND